MENLQYLGICRKSAIN